MSGQSCCCYRGGAVTPSVKGEMESESMVRKESGRVRPTLELVLPGLIRHCSWGGVRQKFRDRENSERRTADLVDGR